MENKEKVQKDFPEKVTHGLNFEVCRESGKSVAWVEIFPVRNAHWMGYCKKGGEYKLGAMRGLFHIAAEYKVHRNK